MIRNITTLFIFLLLAVGATVAQDNEDPNLEIIIDRNFFAIRVIADQPTPLTGLQFGVGAGDTVSFEPLIPELEFNAFVVNTGNCIILKEEDQSIDEPEACTNSIVQNLLEDELFWLSDTTNEPRNVAILSGQQFITICNADGDPCAFTYMPPATNLVIFDDFDFDSSNGSLDSTRWFMEDDCDYTQNDGVITITNQIIQEASFCLLGFVLPNTLYGDEIRRMQAQIAMSADHNGNELNHGIGIYTESFGISWSAFCGLNAESENIAGAFTGTDILEDGEVSSFYTSLRAQYNRLYTFRLEVDPETMEMSCYMDDQLIGTHQPSVADELRAAEFVPTMNSYRSPEAFATTTIDNVRVSSSWGINNNE